MTLICALLTTVTLAAQGREQRITGHVRLVEGGGHVEALPYANVVVLSLPDSTIKAGTASNEKGDFTLSYHRKRGQRYVLKATYMGCKDAITSLRSDKDHVRADTINMLSASFRMRGVMVKEYVLEVEQRGDTTIYNAEAFRLPQGSYLEALVRRVPGLLYDSKTQSISYNGYNISEITINGMEFFKGNRQIALENLPASIVSQLRVYDKETEEEKATGVKSGTKNYVLDLKTKKKLDGSIIASAEVGYGTEDKKDFNAQLFRFNDQGDNFSVVGSTTNRYATSSYKDNITRSIGTNFTKHFGKNLYVAFNADYTRNKTGQQSTSNTEKYLTYGSQYASTETFSLTKSRAFKSNAEVKWVIDSVTVLNVSAYFNYNRSVVSSDNRTASFSDNPENNVKAPFEFFDEIARSILINDNEQEALETSSRADYNVRASLTRKIDKKGSNVSLAVQMTGNDSRGHSHSKSSTTYYRLKGSDGLDSVYQRNQYQYTPSSVKSYRLNISYTHALSRKSRLQIMYGLEMKDEDSSVETYDFTQSPYASIYRLGRLPSGYKDALSDSLSSSNQGHTTGHRFTIRYNYVGRQVSISLGMSVQPQDRSIEKKKGKYYVDTTLYSTELRPTFNFNYRTKAFLLNIGYSGSTRQPSLNSLVAPTDYSSPLNIVRSNPDLKPSYIQQIQAIANSLKTGLTATVGWSHEINSITRSTIYHSETGGIETVPVNINGNWNIQGSMALDRRIGSVRMYLNGGSSYFHTVSLINEGVKEDPDRSCTANLGFSGAARFSFLPSWGNIDINGEWKYVETHNSLRDRTTFTRNYNFGLEGTANLPFDFQLSTQANYYTRRGTGIEGSENDELLWNVKLTWKFLRKKQGEVSLSWVDILNQNKSYTRTVTSSGFNETYQEQLRSYFLVSLKYKLEKVD